MLTGSTTFDNSCGVLMTLPVIGVESSQTSRSVSDIPFFSRVNSQVAFKFIIKTDFITRSDDKRAGNDQNVVLREIHFQMQHSLGTHLFVDFFISRRYILAHLMYNL